MIDPMKPLVDEWLAESYGDSNWWRTQCHAVSLALVRSGILKEPCRVARGTAKGVPGQHSWVVIGMDCYRKTATVVDPTLQNYDSSVSGTLVCHNLRRHQPHGSGSIWNYGKADDRIGPVVELTPERPLTETAEGFLDMFCQGGLDRRAWALLAHAPVDGWPAREILTAMYQTEDVAALIPIDRVGMVTNLNPQELYW